MAFIVAFFSTLLILLLSSLSIWLFIILFFLSTFLFCFFFLNSTFTNFIFSPLEKIHTSVLSQRNHKNNNDKKNDIIENINEEIKGLIEDRKNEVDRIKKLEQYRKEYIGNVSHELKTPVFNIQGYILTLLDGALDDKKVNSDYLMRAEKSVERMINIIEDLESISQLETGELVLEMERFDIIAMSKDVCDGQEMNAAAKGILFSIKNDSPVYVYADRFRIRQVLTNLIVNSVKYGKEYGETYIKATKTNDTVRIDVIDNGIGIDREYIPRLFERFYRVDKSRSRDQGGTGLGLSIVKHILEAHNQNINVTSIIGEGTTFSFNLKSSEVSNI